jgi:hypothetical protein
MRRALQEHRFGLILGAGVSRAFTFKVPDWKELLGRLAAHPKVDGLKVDSSSSTHTSRADLLFRHFATRVRAQLAIGGLVDGYSADRIARGEWRELIREILYKQAPNANQLREHHPYLNDYLDVVLNSPLTITYNFDGYLEMMLAARAPNIDERGRPYETVFDGSKPFRSRTGVIYHPNGYLPQNVLERASDDLIFSEEQFGDQLLATIGGHYSSLAHHLSKNSCLFIGLSLSDENLRHLLRRNAVNNPGHFHYFVDWVNPKNPVTREREQALFEYRFNVYNLITLFLRDDELRALGRLIQTPYDEFKRIADVAGVPTKYVFYLTGVPGIGKTTLLRHLASLSIYDEWLSEPLHLLARPYSELTADEKATLDDWVAKQMGDKNRALLKEREGVFVVERGPLDPISFVETAKLLEKARWYKARLIPTTFDSVCPGEVVLLWGDTAKVSTRIASRQTIKQPPEYLAELQDRLRSEVYAGSGVHCLHSTDLGISELVHAVADVIYLRSYETADLQSRLLRMCA